MTYMRMICSLKIGDNGEELQSCTEVHDWNTEEALGGIVRSGIQNQRRQTVADNTDVRSVI